MGHSVARVQKVQKFQRVQSVEVSPLRAMLIKSALRDWLYGSYGMIRMLVIGSLRSPPPIRAAPDFPLFRGQNRFLCFPAETWLHG